MPVMWHLAAMGMRARINAVLAEKPDLSVRSVSLAAGLSDSMLHKFLRGGTDDMKIHTAEKLAAALGVDPVWLIFGEGDPDRATDIADIVARIPAEQHALARQLLEALARTGTDG